MSTSHTSIALAAAALMTVACSDDELADPTGAGGSQSAVGGSAAGGMGGSGANGGSATGGSAAGGSAAGGSAAGGSGGAVEETVVADAGPDGFLANGGVLDATGTTHPDGAALTYTWTELTGEGVTFGNNGSSNPDDVTVSLPSFPEGVAAAAITLQLDVSGDGDSTDTVDLVLYRTDYAYAAGNGSGDGLSPETPASVSDALATVAATSALTTVAVAEGVVTVSSDPNMDNDIADATSLVLPADVALRGGYAAATWERDPVAYETIITDAATTGTDDNRAILVPAGATGGLVEGFTLRLSIRPNGSTGIYIAADALPTITGNRFETLGTVTLDYGIKAMSSGAIVDGNDFAPGFYTSITMNGAVNGSSRIIRNNVLHGEYSAVTLVNGPTTYVTNNTIIATDLNAVGIWTRANTHVHNNLFFATATASYTQCIEEFATGQVASARNNDFASCVVAMFDKDGNCGDGNCTPDEVNALGAAGYGGNFSTDPVFEDAPNGDFRLAAACHVDIREGGLDGVTEGWGSPRDLDGALRTAVVVGAPAPEDAAGWSIGAYERD